MKIRTKLLISAGVSIAVAFALVLTVLIADRQADQAIMRGDLAQEALDGLLDLNAITIDLLTQRAAAREEQAHGGERTITQWLVSYDSIVTALEADELRGWGGQAAVLNDVQDDLAAIRTTFARLAESGDGEAAGGTESALSPDAEARLTAQLSLRSLHLTSGLDQLSHASLREISGVQQRRTVVVFALLGALLATLVSTSLAVLRSVARPLAALTRAAEAISGGDLSTRVEATSKDEVGVLGRSFNRMAESLLELNRSLREKVGELETEIDERTRAEKTIRHLAYHDGLTDLPNRRLLKDRLTLALAQARRNQEMLAVMFLDLDRFKLVNDTAGHREGDELLRSVSERLRGLVREGDTLARVGGDEFALLLPEVTGVGDAAEVAERILATLGQPQVLGGHEFRITTSIGITTFPADGDDPEALLTNADIAMYHAKEQGRNNYQVYTADMNTSILERQALENDLRHGLEREEFVVYYQPQVNISTGQIVGMEALVRWQHPDRGLLMPTEFIPVADETGLIVPLGEWVLRTACAQTKAWYDAGLSSLRVAVNLSARQFEQRNLVEIVAQVLQETGLDPHCLQLEITESVAIQDVDYTVMMLRHLKEMGVQIAIDDFGTGHSALSYLRRLPIDVVKIDRSFIRDLTISPGDAEITSTVIVMAHNLKLQVIAEGVETAEQLAFLKQRRCDQMQGFLFSRAVSADEFEEILMQGERSEVA